MAWTKEQHAKYHKEWTARNRDKRRAANARWEAKNVAWYTEFKKTLKCNRCGENHPTCLEFHHKNPNEKESLISVAARKWSRKRLLAEISKCEILCSNCHRKHHYDIKHEPE